MTTTRWTGVLSTRADQRNRLRAPRSCAVDKHGSVSLAGTGYRVGNRYVGITVGVRLAGDTVQITLDDALLRTHRARHDRSKEFGALAQPHGKPRKVRVE